MVDHDSLDAKSHGPEAPAYSSVVKESNRELGNYDPESNSVFDQSSHEAEDQTPELEYSQRKG